MVNFTKSIKKYAYLVFFLLLILIWQLVSFLGLVPSFMLPSPISIIKAFYLDFPLLAKNAFVTITEAVIGLLFATVIGFSLSIFMDANSTIDRLVSPLLLFTQTIPTIALAPLLILWFGYGMAPKIVLVFLTCFFPITIGTYGGLKDTDPDAIRLFRAMNASAKQVYFYLKIPTALPEFFSGLRIAATYSLVGAVVSEWLGGNKGLGVYMTRVKNAYAYDKMFAVIFLISILSLCFISLVKCLERKAIPWKINNKTGE